MAENVRVAVRVRPFNSRETARKASIIIQMNGKQTEITDPENTKEKPKKFAFDFSYWSHDGYTERGDGYLEPSSPKYADQQVVFDDLGKGVLDNAWKGYNCSLFAYGQTGSGKSYSMVGYGTNKGIVPLACEDLFRGIDEKKMTAKEGEEYQVKLSMLEIYNEQVRDLLNLKSAQKGGLKVRQHPSKGFYVDTLTSWPVDSYMAIDNKINEGTRNRTVASTNMNATSSRAHTIVAITFVQKTMNEANQNMTKTSIINLVDLAGSERAESTGATGDRLKEGSAINQSLSTLGNCIKALADLSNGKKKTVVPFRDSVLTKLLQNALGGNSKTIMIAALSPADINYEETLSTLRFADRAKAIKTQAVVNESPTDKLIRELREENARLMEMLKGGGGAAVVGTEGSSFNREEEMERLKRELEEQMKESETTWAQKLEEANFASQGQAEEETQKQARRKTVCNFWNLNEDPALTAMVIHFVKDGQSKIGTKNASPPPDIQLNGLGIQKEHAAIENKNNIVTLTPTSGSRILVNGESIKDSRVLHHHDRVLFGSNHLYAFHHPHDESKQKEQGVQVEAPTYDSAQEEIMKHTGLFKDTSGGDGKSKEDLLLQEDLIQLLPMVNEANAMSEELDKKVKFEIALVSPQARGLQHGRTEVNVKMRNLVNGNEWMFDRNNFINRKFLMQEMYQNFMEGSKDWDVERERDPFWEPSSTPVQIGTVHVYLQSLAYMIELQENLAVTDYKGVEQAHLNVEILPCSDDWTECCDEFIEDPGDLLSRALNFKLKVISGRGIQNRFIKSYCRYKFYLDENWVETETIAGTSNPDFNHEKRFTFKPVTQQLLDYLLVRSLVIEVWGQQKPDKSETTGAGAAVAKKSEKTSKGVAKPAPPPVQNTTKDLMSREKTTLGVGATAANTVTVSKEDKIKEEEAKYKAAHEINTYKKIAERAENRLNQLQSLIQGAKTSGDGTIQIADLEAIIAGGEGKGMSSPSPSSNSSNGRSGSVSHTKGAGEKGSATCSLQ
ncbi:kinesin-like protein KIF28P isoform X2 [Haliotis rufescens]|uniref:kinesin-like protein KIF28P isoform X2 n=1 Tax=Haliotis rufescens TaxID=6454 RepID=UPI00201ED6F3|nr:kinesin-like protein KIF28P isoform X2 [Haliotis rufescens]